MAQSQQTDPDPILGALKLLNAQAAGTLVPKITPHASLARLNGTGIAPGRTVFDTVTGQPVTVIDAGTVYIPNPTIDEVKRG